MFEQLIEVDAETVIRTVVERAKRGDAKALSWLWGIMLPARKGAPVEIDLPPLERPSDAPGVIAAIFAAACAGEISPEEGNSLTRMVEAYVRAQQKLGKLGRTAERAKAAEAVAAEMRFPAEPHVRHERQAPSPRAAVMPMLQCREASRAWIRWWRRHCAPSLRKRPGLCRSCARKF
ncbi:MAG: hypothetical protein ABWZ64_14430 [Xanthobacteraceae bacterium]